MSKYTKVSIVIIIWAVSSLFMSLLYYWLKDIGFIFDNPDYLKLPDGGYRYNEMSWNTRKVIFGLTGLSFFAIAVVKIIDIVSDEFKNI
jgi:hypothetical protein